MIAPPSAPAGYTRFVVHGADVVALASHADSVRDALAQRTLYDYASGHPRRRPLRGRVTAFAVPLPDGETRVVVRRSHHGGVLAPITGDLFLPPTRAPRELEMALRLVDAGVVTPEIVAYATYPAARILWRSDVATREIAGGRDLSRHLRDGRPARVVLDATAALLRSLERAGARHPDLNVRNVLIVEGDGPPVAAVLDVDRVVFARPGDRRTGAANLRRLIRSARKLRALGEVTVSDDELAHLASAAGHARF